MLKKLLLFGSIIVGLSASAQNVGQKKNEILNYTDINGMKQGHWIKKDLEGNVIYEGYFQNNFPIGTFTRFHKNGKVKAQLIFDKERKNYAGVTMYDNTGELAAKGFYNDKKKDSIWQYFGLKEKLVYHEVYKNGVRHGNCKKYYPSGQLAEEKEWKNGKMHGIWVQYYPDGSVRLKSAHVNDARTGDFVVFQSSGKPLVKGAYVNDMKDGTWHTYTPKGEVEKELVFTEGKLTNDVELAKEFAKELEEAEKLKGQFPEPSNFQNNPEEYFLNRK